MFCMLHRYASCEQAWKTKNWRWKGRSKIHSIHLRLKGWCLSHLVLKLASSYLVNLWGVLEMFSYEGYPRPPMELQQYFYNSPVGSYTFWFLVKTLGLMGFTPAFTKIIGFSIQMIGVDILHIFHLGVGRDLCGSAIKELAAKRGYWAGGTQEARLQMATRSWSTLQSSMGIQWLWVNCAKPASTGNRMSSLNWNQRDSTRLLHFDGFFGKPRTKTLAMTCLPLLLDIDFCIFHF